MARHHRVSSFRAGELNLTAMIDVAFQLLAFFVITTQPVDVLASLTVYRPAPDPDDTLRLNAPPCLRVTVYPDGYAVNDTRLELEQMSAKLERVAALDRTQGVRIQCLNESAHGKLVEVLNTCAKAGLTNLSVVSSGAQ